MLHFLNYLDFTGYLSSDEYSNFNRVKNVLTDIFQDVDSTQPILMLGIIDDLRILLLNKHFNEINALTETLRENVLTLYEEKTIEE